VKQGILAAAVAPLPCGIYVRISKDRLMEGLGVARQEGDCRALAEKRGWAVVDVYCDNDVSASGKKKREQWERLLADLQSGRIRAIVAWHVDRLTRRPVELEGVIDMADRLGVQLATVNGEIDLGTPTGRAMARILGAWARLEVEQKSLRQQAANKQRAHSGEVWCGGMRCYGYTEDGHGIIEKEAEIIREMTKRVINGDSLRSLVLELVQRGITTTTGGPWQALTIRRLLQNPRLTGKRVYRGEVVAQGQWPAILEEATQQRLIAVLADPARRKDRSQPGEAKVRKYLLTGILVCGICGKPLQAQPSNAGRRGYVCRKTPPYGGCGRIRIAAEPLELDVAERVLARFASPSIRQKLAAASTFEDDATLTEQIGELERRQVENAEDYANDLLDRRAYRLAQEKISTRIKELRGRIMHLTRLEHLPTEVTPVTLAQWWADASLQRRRDLIQTVFEQVVIGPTTRPGFQGLDEARLTYIAR
jgi:DNA invertase Pin-like site-specific DNA recombinase